MNPLVRTVEDRDGAWLRVVLNRPRPNLLSLDMVRALQIVVTSELSRPVPRKWISFEGAGEEFSFGAMVQEHLPGAMEQVLPQTHGLLRQMLALPVPTAALIRGRCLGGAFELALACDTIIAASDAVLGLPEIHLAAFPPAGSVLLPLKVGAARAATALLTGTLSPANWWRDVGVVTLTVASDELLKTAADWFDAHLAPRSAVALSAAAEASRLVLRSTVEPALTIAERLYLEQLLRTHDAAEGVRAFIERRQPVWKDC